MESNLKKEIILKYNNVNHNIYIKDKDIINDFFEKFAKKKQLTYKKQTNSKIKKIEVFSNNSYIGGMMGMKSSTTGKIAFDICRDKFRLEQFLKGAGLPTLESKVFLKEEKENAKKLIIENPTISYVLKPLSLAGGKGIELGVKEFNFSRSWENSMKVQMESSVKEPACIVQSYVDGFDIRICIIEGVFAAALLRIPAHVVGDGIQSIKELIETKNNSRRRSEYFNKRLIDINGALLLRLKDQGYNLNDRVGENEIVMLHNVGNLLAGADSIDITDKVSDDLIQLAINATAAIPGLHTSGVDIMTTDYTKGEGYIIEVNTNANHKVHHLPYKGQKRFPYLQLVESLIVKHKIKNSLMLVEDEIELNKSIQQFLKLKTDYSDNLFYLTSL